VVTTSRAVTESGGAEFREKEDPSFSVASIKGWWSLGSYLLALGEGVPVLFFPESFVALKGGNALGNRILMKDLNARARELARMRRKCAPEYIRALDRAKYARRMERDPEGFRAKRRAIELVIARTKT
jgi:hypothetical protein